MPNLLERLYRCQPRKFGGMQNFGKNMERVDWLRPLAVKISGTVPEEPSAVPHRGNIIPRLIPFQNSDLPTSTVQIEPTWNHEYDFGIRFRESFPRYCP